MLVLEGIWKIYAIWGFPKIGVFTPPNPWNFNRVLHEINPPFWAKNPPIFGNIKILCFNKGCVFQPPFRAHRQARQGFKETHGTTEGFGCQGANRRYKIGKHIETGCL